MADFRLETERLILRDWRDEDVDDMHRLGTDPDVMATLGPLMSRAQTIELIEKLQKRAAEHGHTFWALERREDARVLGFCGVIRGYIPQIDGELELGWRLARDAWSNGYAIEGARATVDWLKANREDDHAVAITAQTNTRSRAVMERLGMIYQPERDFDHPGMDLDDPLTPHVLYELALTG